MEENNLEHLRKQPGKISHELIISVFNDLREYYYLQVSGKKYSQFKDDLKRRILLDIKITNCKISELLKSVGKDDLGVLKGYGITYEDLKQIHSAILRLETELRLIDIRMNKSDNEESVKFNELRANIDLQMPHQIDTGNMTLEQWCGIWNALIEKNKIVNGWRDKQRTGIKR